MNMARNVLKKSVQIIFAIVMLYMLFVNIVRTRFDIGIIVFWIMTLIILSVLVLMLYKKKVITSRHIGIGVIVLFIFGIIARIFFIVGFEMELASDFLLFYQTSLRDSNWRGNKSVLFII
ncbi:MAG: hypothetical protein FWC79_07870 [Oscillospiraceae bacterium]|nr:hypothetical protein [Oscillospiraceae bacterium]